MNHLAPYEEHKARIRRGIQSYHYAWLKAHPHRTMVWLKAMMREGFHVHHVDGNHSNDDPSNLILVDGTDHMRLHGMVLRDGLRRWRSERQSFKASPVRKPVTRSFNRHRIRPEIDNFGIDPSSWTPQKDRRLDHYIGAKWLCDMYRLSR